MLLLSEGSDKEREISNVESKKKNTNELIYKIERNSQS